jgi:hypothetical protein
VAYVGNQPARGQWRKLTDISASFNGVLTTFTTSVPPGTSEYYVTAGSASQLVVSLGGVIQQPDLDYTVSTNSITFTTAPAGGLSFFAVLGGDALNTGTPSDGTVTSSKLAGSLNVGLAAGSAAAPSLFFTGDSNTGVYSPGADQIAISTDGTARLSVDASGNITTTGTFVDPAITGAIKEDIFTITDGAAFEVDPGNGSIQLITLGASRTPKATNFVAGEAVTLMVDDGSAYTLTWSDATWGGSGVVWKTNAGAAPTLNTTGYTVITFWKVATQVYGARVGDA